VQLGGVGRSATWYSMFSPMQLQKRDTYTPNATPSNPNKQMNDTLTRWGVAFSRARCRCGAHRFIGSRGRRGRKKWSGCGRPARVACCVKRRITENKGINNQQLANPLVSHTHTHMAPKAARQRRNVATRYVCKIMNE
jgi:hypothetical protein